MLGGGGQCRSGSRTEGSKFRDKKLRLWVPGMGTSDANGLLQLRAWFPDGVNRYVWPRGQETRQNFKKVW